MFFIFCFVFCFSWASVCFLFRFNLISVPVNAHGAWSTSDNNGVEESFRPGCSQHELVSLGLWSSQLSSIVCLFYLERKNTVRNALTLQVEGELQYHGRFASKTTSLRLTRAQAEAWRDTVWTLKSDLIWSLPASAAKRVVLIPQKDTQTCSMHGVVKESYHTENCLISLSMKF